MDPGGSAQSGPARPLTDPTRITHARCTAQLEAICQRRGVQYEAKHLLTAPAALRGHMASLRWR